MFSLKRKPKIEPGTCTCAIYPMPHHESWCTIELPADEWALFPHIVDEWAAKS